MAQRNPARPPNGKNGSLIRYDVVWMLPFAEFTRVGYQETQTWWLDSIHGSEVNAQKRFNAIAAAVASGNGCIVLFEILTNPSASTFSQRAILRAGRNQTPPPVGEINPISAEVEQTFRSFHARWAERNRNTAAGNAPRSRIQARKRRKSNFGVFATLAAVAAAAAIAVVAGYHYSSDAAPAAANVFSAARGADGEYVVSTERPNQRIVVPVHGAENKCEFSEIKDNSVRYLGTGACRQPR